MVSEERDSKGLVLRGSAEKPRVSIPNFGALLLAEEGPGILNWTLDGVRMLFKDLDGNKGRLDLKPEQRKRVDRAMSESDSLRMWIGVRVRWETRADVTTEEMLEVRLRGQSRRP